ncbi:MAG: glutamate--cysteine ligase [Arenicellales bacterium]
MSLEQSFARIINGGMERHFQYLQRGIEKESLRVNPDGTLAKTPHPKALGSALTHSSITTDYSEALLEFVTPVHTNIDALLKQLTDIHHFTYQNVGDEKLWVNSMPCVMEGDEMIRIARYGSSNVAKMKEAYRRGLGHRYGRLMQTIAGIHFNFSLPEQFWDEYLEFEDRADRKAQKSAHYFALTRNFLRHSWLACYLFGASPAVCKSFLNGRQHHLDEHDGHSFYAPFATSLRLSDLGYSNNVQAGIEICYDTLEEYASTLLQAIQTPHPAYQVIPQIIDGKYQQLNPNLLQIENEFYAVIRPKQIAESGESPSRALMDRGVEYVEVRSLDLNPFAPVGIDAECIRFFDVFLLFCLLSDSPPISSQERHEAAENRQRAVLSGRQSGLMLSLYNDEIPFKSAANRLLARVSDVASLLDDVVGGNAYRSAIENQRARVEDANLTPSAKILAEMERDHDSFYAFAMSKAKEHEKHFKDLVMDQQTMKQYQDEAAASLERQRQIEESDLLPFDEFLVQYFARQNQTTA